MFRPRSLVVLAALGVAGCGARRGAPEPRAILVAPAATTQSPLPPPEAATTAEETQPIELAISSHAFCARVSGHVHCTTDLDPDRPLTASPALEGIEDAVSLSLGAGFGCAVLRTGSVLCFGGNGNGELGARLRAGKSEKPVVVTGITNAKRVVAGDTHACALLAGGTVRCWGRNESGQTGGATSYLSAAHELVVPDVVESVSGVTSLAVGSASTCATTRSRAVMCWGREPFGLDAFHGPRAVKPAAVSELAGFDELAANGGTFCGITHGEVKCWGELWSLLTADAQRAGKLPVVGVTRARHVRVSRGHACAVLTDGAITCWGSNYQGALGRGETTGYDALEPEVVKGLPFAIDVAVGGEMSCATTSAHEVYCWGSWAHGQQARKESAPVKIRIAD